MLMCAGRANGGRVWWLEKQQPLHERHMLITLAQLGCWRICVGVALYMVVCVCVICVGSVVMQES